MRMLALTKYGAQAASTRQRLLQYRPSLAAAGIAVDWHALLNDDYVRSLANGARPARTAIASGYLRRLAHLARAGRYDVLWVYAELFPYLPATFEKLAFMPGKPVVYDFDDAFFHQYDAHPSGTVRHMLADKLHPLIAGAAACCCGNAYLEGYAARLNPRTIILPTVVDTDAYRPAPPGEPGLTIGWIGTPSTWRYMQPLVPQLRELVERFGVRVRVVGAGPAAEADRFPGLELIPWSEDGEVREVQAFDIGVMPLPDERWARGKSGYKLIQYMACGLPVVASPVGVNTEIVTQGEVGYLARDPDEWREALVRLITEQDARRAFGRAARARAVERYSLQSQAPRLIALLQSVR